MNKIEWFEEVSRIISSNVEAFYQDMYGAKLKKVSKSYRVEPCPRCGHHDCCTITPGANMGGCFSGGCDFHGTHINMYITYVGNKQEAIERIADYLRLPYPYFSSPEDEARFIHYERLAEIRKIAVDHYHEKLMQSDKELDYQLNKRHRTVDELFRYGIGLAKNYLDLHGVLTDRGYSKDEIKEASVWIPEGLFIYPIFNNRGRIVRLNTKNPFNVMFEAKDDKEAEVIKGFSRGDKVWLINPNSTFKRIILLEGENDHITVCREIEKEKLDEDVLANCGQLSDEQLEQLDGIVDRYHTEVIFTFFDNDAAGEKYTELINNRYPHIDVRQINYSTEYKDPDDYFNKHPSPTRISKLLKDAKPLVTEEYKISRDKNIWTLKTRSFELQFDLQGKNRSNALEGDIVYVRGGEIDDMARSSTLDKFKKCKPYNYKLLDHIEGYYNNDIKERSMDELIDVYRYCKHKPDIIRRLAELLHEAPGEDREELVIKIRKGLRDEVADIVLKEVNELQNKSIKNFIDIPKIRVGQFFSVKNNDAFMYFTYMKQDGDAIRRLPYLISNRKKLIRLDLYKRKDEQCLLLIENKYELPYEVPQAILEVQEASLSQYWVEKWLKDEIPPEELKFNYLVGEIESFVRRMYIFSNPIFYKIISIYIFATYFYELFAEMPYLLLNGSKGSGKTILDTTLYLLCFNAKHSIHISEAALFRTITFEGGTFILDEMENMTSRQKNADSTMATVLKGGYSRSGKVYRVNTEKGNVSEGFDIYGPKIISNIFGVEDIIADRCIPITTFEAKVTSMNKIEDPKVYAQEKLDIVRELTSKCCISALTNFQEVFDVFSTNRFVTGNARLSQILRPLLAIATLAGTDYVDALMQFYEEFISASKEEIEKGTPEGIIKEVLQNISEELVGKAHRHYTMPDIHKYGEDIKYSKKDGWFEVNQMHLKVFYEECNPGTVATFSEVNSWIKRVLPLNLREDRRRTSITITNEDLLKELNGMRRIKVNVYRLYLKDFLEAQKAVIEKDDDKATAIHQAQAFLSQDVDDENPPF